MIAQDDRYVYAQSSATIALPETLRNSLMARLDRAPLSKEIAQIGSVIGREFSYELIAGLEIVGEETLRKGLQHLTTSGLASCQGDIPNAVYTFSHAMVQDAAYKLAARESTQAIASRRGEPAAATLAGHP